ncbi:hypothetical protein BHM03_00017564 [Ensete ventricosum]|nr:hypothetical protein BHM03_00017564 [Ensete ventricosum]
MTHWSRLIMASLEAGRVPDEELTLISCGAVDVISTAEDCSFFCSGRGDATMGGERNPLHIPFTYRRRRHGSISSGLSGKHPGTTRASPLAGFASSSES